MPHLHLYMMTHDTGFAPNPCKGVLTLATCKPRIRKHAAEGDWISGWTAKRVVDREGKRLSFPEQRLIYLARIAKKLTFAEYWKQYPQKRPLAAGTGRIRGQPQLWMRKFPKGHAQAWLFPFLNAEIRRS